MKKFLIIFDQYGRFAKLIIAELFENLGSNVQMQNL